jgi:NAD(P)-dependent dehydrogenase (short-subunit alcohol dehydrogenase family)
MTAEPVALVTGAGRGLGRGIALRLAADGARVIVAARTRPQLDSLVAEIEAAGGSAFAMACDVTDAGAVERAANEARARFGPVTLLVNNAGNAGPMGPIGTVDPAAWWETQRIHVMGALLFMTHVIPQMEAAGGGRIINVCSQAGTFVAANYSSYAVAKCALIRLTEHVDAERRAQNIRAFPIQPGTILTDIAADTIESEEAKLYAAPLIALLKTITPEDSDRSLARLQDFVSDIARGRWDTLSGRYLDVDWDLEQMAASEVGG